MAVDDVLVQLGGCGRFQTLVFLILSLTYMRGSWHVFAIIYLGDAGEHTCLPPLLNGTEASHNHSSEELIVKDKCHVTRYFMNGSVNTSTRTTCSSWNYQTEFEETIVTEWNLVCSQNYVVELSMTVYMIGTAVGALTLTAMADRFGRKKIILPCLVLQTVAGTGVAFVNSIILFTALRFIVGFLNMGISLTTYVLMTELFPASHRTQPSIAIQCFWAGGLMSLALFGYSVRNWRYLQLLITLPNILAIGAFWFVPESLQWLLATKKTKRAIMVLKNIARVNRLSLFLGNGLTDENVSSLQQLLQFQGNSVDSYLKQCTLNQNCNEDNKEMDCNEVAMAARTHRDVSLSKGELENSKSVKTEKDQNEGQMTDCFSAKLGGRNEKQNVLMESADQINDDFCEENVPDEETNFSETDSQNGDHICIQKVLENQTLTIPKQDKQDTEKSVCDLFRSPRLRLYTIIIFYLFLVNSLSYFGISLSTPILHGNPFLNLFLMGLVELPAYFICMFAIVWSGRRLLLCGFLLLCAVTSSAAVFIPEQTESGVNLQPLKICLVMLGKFGITGSYSTVYLFSAEVFPTVVRNQAMGMASFFESLGSISAPFIVYAAKTLPKLPLLLFSVLTFIGSIVVLLLPETKQKPLPETFEEVESWFPASFKRDSKNNT